MQRTLQTTTRQILKLTSFNRCTFPLATTSSHSSSLSHPPRFLSTSTPISLPLKSTQTTHLACPSCSTPLPSPLTSPSCLSCSQLVPPPPSPSTAYQLFSLPSPPKYSIDSKELKKEFLKLQQLVHPDRFGGQGQDREEWAKVWSGRVNDAYKLLLNPLERGEYLLELNGVTIGESDPVTDPELLMSIMEVREALEEATTPQQVDSLRQTNSRAIEEAIESLKEKLDGQEKDLQGAKDFVIQLKYLNNVEQVCREWTPGKRLEIQH
ncbi:hypothetical protein JCM5353_006814 [Sporobolomyces roseus]